MYVYHRTFLFTVKKSQAQPVPNDVKTANRKNLFASKESKKKETPIKGKQILV